MKYLSTFEVAEKWGISPRRVGILCNNDRIPVSYTHLDVYKRQEVRDEGSAIP